MPPDWRRVTKLDGSHRPGGASCNLCRIFPWFSARSVPAAVASRSIAAWAWPAPQVAPRDSDSVNTPRIASTCHCADNVTTKDAKHTKEIHLGANRRGLENRPEVTEETEDRTHLRSLRCLLFKTTAGIQNSKRISF